MYADVASQVEELVVETCWRQWRALQGEGLAHSASPARAIIDPEALVLASLAVRHREQRLRDVLLWWAGHGARLLSVQRVQTVARLFPDTALKGGVGWFATLALEAGDARWKRLASGLAADESARPGKGPAKLHLLEPSTMMLRLRAGFGVGVKADVLSFLIGAASEARGREVWATAPVVSEAIGYSRASVSRAVAEMSVARFIDASGDRPPMYSLDAQQWAHLLRLRDPFKVQAVHENSEQENSDIPAWRFWGHLFAFLLAVGDWAREADTMGTPAVVSASRARDIVERFQRQLAWNGLTVPDADRHPGERYLDAFHGLRERVCAFVAHEL